MKKLILVVSVALLLAGCGSENSGSTAPETNAVASEGSPLDAPTDYLKAINKGQQSAVKTVDTSAINRAVQMFNVDQGRNPKSLNELVEMKYLPQVPDAPYGMKLDYDSTAGTVRVVPK